MKKIILNKVLLTLIVTLSYTLSFAQLYIDKDFFIGDNATVYVKGIQVQFSAASTTTTTTRTATTYGKLWMDAASSLATIDITAPTTPFPSSSHFMDGYVRSDRTTQFLYPVGQTGVIGFAATTAATTTPIDVAFFRGNASTTIFAPAIVAGTKGTDVTEVSTVEYWDIIGTNSASISLTWRTSSSFTALGVLTPAQLSIVGLNKSTNTWEIIPSTIDATSILTGTSDVTTSGSITSNAVVDLATYRYFTFAKKGNCLPVLANTGGTTIWTTSWSNGDPDATKTAQINSLYTGPSFTCNSLVLNANIELENGEFIDCVNGVTGTGKIIMATNANFFQRNSSSTAPNIIMTKLATHKRLNDWTYFSTPLADGEITAMATAVAFDSPNVYPANAFGSFRVWNHSVSNQSTNWVAATNANVVPGRGFIARVKQQNPFLSELTFKNIQITFDGLAFNGDVTSTTASSTQNDNMSTVLLGNPYPSVMDADQFIRDNPNLTGVLRFWDHSYTVSGTSGGGSNLNTQSDFALYNLTGGTAATTGSTVPNKYIAAGQGFNVNTAVTGASSDIFFNNCMRVSNPTDIAVYFRNSTQSESNKNRFWLNVTNNDNLFYNESLIAYLPETTLGFDRMYDAVSISNSEYTISSFINNDKYSIQSRSNFNALDVVPLHVKKASSYTGNMIISLKDKEGIFNSNEVTIFLHDKQLNVYHNLEMSDYTFTLNETETSSRFEIVYQTTALNNQNFDLNTVNITLFSNDFKVISKDLIENITIYDVSGRLIQSYKDINKTDFTSNFNHEDGIYIAKVQLQNGNITSQKITNLNK